MASGMLKVVAVPSVKKELAIDVEDLQTPGDSKLFDLASHIHGS